MKKNYFMLVCLVLISAFSATAQVTSVADLFGKYRFTADVEFTEEDLRVNCSKTFDLERIEGIRYIRYRIVEGWKAPHTGPGMYGSATEIYFWGLSKKIIALPE